MDTLLQRVAELQEERDELSADLVNERRRAEKERVRLGKCLGKLERENAELLRGGREIAARERHDAVIEENKLLREQVQQLQSEVVHKQISTTISVGPASGTLPSSETGRSPQSQATISDQDREMVSRLEHLQAQLRVEMDTSNRTEKDAARQIELMESRLIRQQMESSDTLAEIAAELAAKKQRVIIAEEEYAELEQRHDEHVTALTKTIRELRNERDERHTEFLAMQESATMFESQLQHETQRVVAALLEIDHRDSKLREAQDAETARDAKIAELSEKLKSAERYAKDMKDRIEADGRRLAETQAELRAREEAELEQRKRRAAEHDHDLKSYVEVKELQLRQADTEIGRLKDRILSAERETTNMKETMRLADEVRLAEREAELEARKKMTAKHQYTSLAEEQLSARYDAAVSRMEKLERGVAAEAEEGERLQHDVLVLDNVVRTVQA